MQNILKKVYVHMPFLLLPQLQEMVLREKMNLEIYFNHLALNELDHEQCRQTAELLAASGVQVTFHAPFMDLRPGALDNKIRQTSIDRLKQVFDLVPYFHPLRIVCHTAYDSRYYVSCDEEWLENSAATWLELIDLIRRTGSVIALENVYEREPSILRRLFERLNSDYICFCLDTGHFNVFARTALNVWLEELGQYLGHLHLHDNHGKFDEHLPVGNGTFPFAELFQILQDIKARPSITLEAHTQADLWQSLDNIKKMGILG
ncbi:MAG: sugar phosphate isomerase/epimerase family protein [Smithellaceae bacterium]